MPEPNKYLYKQKLNRIDDAVRLKRPDRVQQVKDECLKLIETIGSDGGFIMGSSCPLDEAKIENVKTMVEVTTQYRT
jgi:hypothetical protein